MKCKVCSSEIEPQSPRCSRCGTTAPAAGPRQKRNEIRIKEAQPAPGSGAAYRRKNEPAGTTGASPDGFVMMVGRPGRDDEVFDAYRAHIQKKLSCLPPEDERVQRCMHVFERMVALHDSGDMERALRFASTCVSMLEEIAPMSRKPPPPSRFSPELKKIAQRIEELQSKSLEIGVNILDSEKLRVTAIEALRMNAVEQGARMLERSLELLSDEIRAHVLQLLQVYQTEAEKAKGVKIDAAGVETAIKRTRILLAKRDLPGALDAVHEIRNEVLVLKMEYNRKTNTFDCPVCGAVNSVESRECQVCETIFPELGPIYKGERIKVAPPFKKLR